MKAHDGWLEVVQHVGGFGAEGRAQKPRRDGGQVEPELSIVRRQQGSPTGFAFGARRRRCVAEKVDVVRLCRVRRDVRQLCAHGVWIEHRAGKRAEAARVRHGNGHAAVLDTGHRRLNDRELDA